MSISSHPFPFDPTYGYDREALQRIELSEEAPADFEAFWQELHAASRKVPPCPFFEPGEKQRTAANIAVRPIRYTSLGGRKIGGWLTTPLEGDIQRLVVVGHGYGGCAEPVEPVMPDAACLFFCARGLPERSLFDDLPSSAAFHVLAGIEDRFQYIHGGCCADLWAAASALRELTGRDDLPLHYWGGSFGGGIGALALPWDDRFAGAFLVVPSFGNHPVRLRIRCTGSGEAVRLRWQRTPEIAETLRYFDAAQAARFLRLPTLYACALFDPGVPPPGQFSVWRAHAGPKKLFTLSAGHFDHPAAEQETAAARREACAFLRGIEQQWKKHR